jgi:hypothetical protein
MSQSATPGDRGAQEASAKARAFGSREEGPVDRVGGERRCPTCGGLVAADADWCGQCYASMTVEQTPSVAGRDTTEREEVDAPRDRTPERVPSATTTSRAATAVALPGGGAVEVAEGTATWACPACGDRNPMDESLCATCQTPFRRLFEAPVRRDEIDPPAAVGWSLLLPGLGHWKAGARADGIARIVLAAWTVGTVVIMVLARPAGGFGRSFPLFLLYLVAAVALYVEAVVDARRVASGFDPLVSSRTLMWCAAGMILGSIVLATFVTLPAARR